jgi:hypothetical protein
LSEEWEKILTPKQQEDMKDRLANLIPLSQQMNQGLGNAGYSKKRQKYEDDAMFKAAREFAKQYITWSPNELEARAILLADWLVKRWPD